jgi:hypothetical protein
MSLTKCPACRRLNFVKAESCPSCERVFRPGELRAFGRRNNSLFAGLFLLMLAVLTFVVLRGA